MFYSYDNNLFDTNVSWDTNASWECVIDICLTDQKNIVFYLGSNKEHQNPYLVY